MPLTLAEVNRVLERVGMRVESEYCEYVFCGITLTLRLMTRHDTVLLSQTVAGAAMTVEQLETEAMSLLRETMSTITSVWLLLDAAERTSLGKQLGQCRQEGGDSSCQST